MEYSTQKVNQDSLPWSLLHAEHSSVKPFRVDIKATSSSSGTTTTGRPYDSGSKDLHVDDT